MARLHATPGRGAGGGRPPPRPHVGGRAGTRVGRRAGTRVHHSFTGRIRPRHSLARPGHLRSAANRSTWPTPLSGRC
ncbi:hypothetical protein F750_0682 [Streptomyces sp. PAMC 26508]|nr:hypothetical protein F750_0682 [Streptomyces sp. PAMC 26508]